MMKAASRLSPEQALWDDRIAVLAAAVTTGKPDAIPNIKREIERLDRHMTALVCRMQLSLRTSAQVEADLDLAEARMKQLAQLAQGMKLERPADDGPTPEVIARPSRRDAIKALEEAEVAANRISPHQANMARRIARVYQAIAAAGQAKIGRMDGAGRGSGGFRIPDMPDHLDDERIACYLPWARWLSEHAPVTLAIVVQVSVFNLSMHAVRVKQKLGRAAALDKLRDGLDRYSDLYRDYARLTRD